MKYIFTFIASAISIMAFAQTPVKTTAEYNGQKYPCYVIAYNLPPDHAGDVIKNKLKTEGYTPKKSKGYLVYRNVRLKDLDPNSDQDLLFKIEQKSRKEKDESVVTMIIAKAGEIPEDKVKGAKMVADVTSSENSVNFLNSFQNDMNLTAYNLAVETQTNEVAKAEKELDDLQKEQAKIERKIEDYQDQLSKNKKNQENQLEEIAKQKKLLKDKIADNPQN